MQGARSPRKVIYAGIALFVGIAVSIGFVMSLFALHPSPAAPSKPALEATPRLQVEEGADRAALETAAVEKLTGYEWVDRSSGTVRIPIERAMELLAGQGWSDAQGSPAP